jgi:hypothetical protein
MVGFRWTTASAPATASPTRSIKPNHAPPWDHDRKAACKRAKANQFTFTNHSVGGHALLAHGYGAHFWRSGFAVCPRMLSDSTPAWLEASICAIQ